MNNSLDRRSYSVVLGLPGVARLVLSTMLGRSANQMSTLVLILFALRTYHSPALAGAVVLVQLAAVPVGPLAGALVDRLGSSIMIALDFAAAAAITAVIAILAFAHLLPAVLFVLLVLLGTVTWPFSGAGVKALLPQIVPATLWDRANALDSVTSIVASIAGPVAAGTMFGLVGPEPALATVATLYVLAAFFILGLRGTAQHRQHGPIFGQALSGLGYFYRNRQLRGLALAIVPANISVGILVVAMPVLLLRTLHQPAETVGWIWAVVGAFSLVGALVVGRMGTRGRERSILALAMLVPAPGLAVAAVAPGVAVSFLVAALVGIGLGPLDVALFSLRQRAVDPAWYGRAIAVSMTLNASGGAIGGGLGGVVSQASPKAALLISGLFTVVAAAAAMTIPAAGRLTTLSTGLPAADSTSPVGP
ncbi:MAG TPA: MFS transporter [Candidatus Nanopelagicaceae bacterium]|nr:MFS transporter [Candidatus Nanopelagicaceae bacterium]